MAATEITKETSVAEIVKLCPGARRIFDEHGLRGCGGEHGPSEPLEFFAAVHQANLEELLREINAEFAGPSGKPYVYKASLQDYIYRRFFKAGVAIVLTVGCLWGAINLLQIALGKNFLNLHLLPSIHVHAHAMIFGWVGMFVMGFAYQSFPRFKNTSLWRPQLANLSFYLLAAGIACGDRGNGVAGTRIIGPGCNVGGLRDHGRPPFLDNLVSDGTSISRTAQPVRKVHCFLFRLVSSRHDPGSAVLLREGHGSFRAGPHHADRSD
jgi:hypothetical protein